MKIGKWEIATKSFIAIVSAAVTVIASGIIIPIAINNGNKNKPCAHTYLNDCDATCELCQQEREITHAFAEADCVTAKTCTLCGATEGEALGHTPNEDDGDCTTDITCSVCNQTTTSGKTEHVARADDGNCTTEVTCAECSVVLTEAKSHDFTGEWEKNIDGHWHACQTEGCTIIETPEAHVSSGAATETAAEICTVCEFVITPEVAHTHKYNIPNKDETHHWTECRCGDKQEVTPHGATDDHDCTTADICSCGHVVTAAKDHTPGKDDGNCTTEVPCSVCGKTSVASTSGHNDADGDHVCDNGDCQITLPDAPTDENPGIDLPIVPN